MDLALLFIIVLQFIYMVYKDVAFSKEREKLQLKAMSKDVAEYVEAIQTLEPDVETKKEEEEDIYVNVDDLSVETILKAKDNT